MTTLLQDTAIWFEEKVVTDLPADRQEEAIEIEQTWMEINMTINQSRHCR